jgi:hypothetical protein
LKRVAPAEQMILLCRPKFKCLRFQMTVNRSQGTLGKSRQDSYFADYDEQVPWATDSTGAGNVRRRQVRPGSYPLFAKRDTLSVYDHEMAFSFLQDLLPSPAPSRLGAQRYLADHVFFTKLKSRPIVLEGFARSLAGPPISRSGNSPRMCLRSGGTDRVHG